MNERLAKSVVTFAVVTVALGLVVSAFAGVVASPVQKSNPSAIDYSRANAMPLPMPAAPALMDETSATVYPGQPGFEPGGSGNGSMSPVSVISGENDLSDILESQSGGQEPQEYGASDMPFTTSRVDVTATNAVSKLYPFSAAGKLYFNISGSTYICSASLIKKGLVVTAAHCVANFGKQQWYSNWQFIPALYGTTAPYGIWNVSQAWVKTSYFNGTDPCATAGVVCKDDVAVLVVAPAGTRYPGTTTGYFGYGWNGYGCDTSASPNILLVNQLSYPKSHDAGLKMQRTDAQGFVSSMNSNNTVWGTRQTGGSSGGPILVNLGAPAVLTNGVTFGAAASFNIVVGVTSWGYKDLTTMEQGASPFLSTNIVSLVNAACASVPAACAP